LREDVDTHSRLESCVKVREELVVRSVGSARCHVQEPVTILVDVGSGLAHCAKFHHHVVTVVFSDEAVSKESLDFSPVLGLVLLE
jgi:hypothetical protein